MDEGRLLYLTKSVCPVCLGDCGARVVERAGGVYLEKRCPDHGSFSTLVWADSGENYLRWLSDGGVNALPQTEEALEQALAGLDFDCAARCQPASAALMTTSRCNLRCPVCFTRDSGEPLHEPDLAECEGLLRRYRAQAGEDALLELCGGEPTVRPDLPELAALAREIGFDYIQLNTNGVRLAEDAAYCEKLRAHGVTTVYLGFDGVTDRPYLAKYGRPMLAVKQAAVENCRRAGLAVVLVTCVIPGENDGELGDIVSYAQANMPAVKGVYFQPISYFGAYPEEPRRRITIPEVIRRLEAQHPDLSAGDFRPGTYEHPQCSFNACYLLDKKGRLRPLTSRAKGPAERGGIGLLRKKIRGTWLPGPNPMLTVGGMAFQDGWTVDLLRLRRCSIQILQKDGRRIPLCGKYLTGRGGCKRFPGIG